MGADLCLEMFWEEIDDKNNPVKEPDWESGMKAIDNLTQNQLDSVDYIGDNVKDQLKEYLSEVKETYNRDNRRDLIYLTFHPYRIWITGGMSWGDSPSDMYDTLCPLNQLDILEECGLNPDLSYRNKALHKILDKKEMLPLLIGINKDLDKDIEKRLKT